jgi:hypothetical protein
MQLGASSIGRQMLLRWLRQLLLQASREEEALVLA